MAFDTALVDTRATHKYHQAHYQTSRFKFRQKSIRQTQKYKQLHPTRYGVLAYKSPIIRDVMKWPVGWPLLILSFFTHEPYREQLLAGQTILCCIVQEHHPFHTATIVSIVSYFTHQTDIQAAPTTFILHHIIVICAVASHYVDMDYKAIIWVLTAWSTRWLGCQTLFDSPLRTLIKCILFRAITSGPWANATGTKWCWLLFVHEIMWCLLPIQILYEVYHKKKEEITFIV